MTLKHRKTKAACYSENMKKARQAIKKKEPLRAIADLSKAIMSRPKSAKAYFLRGLLFESLEKYESALKDYNKAVKISPHLYHVYNHRARAYAHLGKFRRAFGDLETLSKLEPRLKLNCLMNAGATCTMKKDFNGTLNYYRQALLLKPKDLIKARIHEEIGRAYHELKQYDKALENVKLAVELDPRFPDAFTSLGIVYADKHDDEKALENLLKAVELDPRSLDGLLNLGVFYRLREQYDKASEVFTKFTEAYPKRKEGYFELGLTAEATRQYDKALDQYNKIHELFPKDAHTYTHKGIIYGNLGEYLESKRNLCKAISLNRNEEMAYLNRAEVCMDLGQYHAALNDFQRTIHLNPDSDFAYFGKGKALCYLTDEKTSFREKKSHEHDMLEAFEKTERTTQDDELKELARWWKNFSKKYFDASAENKKRLRIFAETYEQVVYENLFSKVTDEQSRLSNFLTSPKTVASGRFFQVLRRWNSFTPIIPSKSRSNLGGGYLLVCEGHGVVIDPGYNFVENFLSNGFVLSDIDDIVLTHAHDDHTADFEPLLSLISRNERPKKISLFANLGASVKFSHLLAKNEGIFTNIEILNENQTYQILSTLKMRATKAQHKDVITEHSAKGLIFEMKMKKGQYRIGVTGDTILFKGAEEHGDLCSFFENIDVLILHLGSIHKREFDLLDDDFQGHRYEGAHLGIRGVVNMIARCRPKLAIISEFGEELKEIRTNIANKIDNCFENYDSTGNSRVIPADIGLTIAFEDDIRVKCEICGASVTLQTVKYTETLISDKISYHCKNHNRKEIVDKFRREEEKKLRSQAKIIGCETGLTFPSSHLGTEHLE